MRNDGTSFLDSISKKTLERLLGLGTAAVVIGGACLYALGRPPADSANLFVALNADGSSEGQYHLVSVWPGPMPLTELTFGNSAPLAEDRWIDGKGRFLEVRSEATASQGFERTVYLQEPVFPNERVELKEITKTTESVVRRDGADYVFQTTTAWGNAPTALTYTLKLPSGAKVVSTQPKVAWRCQEGDRLILVFNWTEKPGHHPELKVKYSLPRGEMQSGCGKIRRDLRPSFFHVLRVSNPVTDYGKYPNRSRTIRANNTMPNMPLGK